MLCTKVTSVRLGKVRCWAVVHDCLGRSVRLYGAEAVVTDMLGWQAWLGDARMRLNLVWWCAQLQAILGACDIACMLVTGLQDRGGCSWID